MLLLPSLDLCFSQDKFLERGENDVNFKNSWGLYLHIFYEIQYYLFCNSCLMITDYSLTITSQRLIYPSSSLLCTNNAYLPELAVRPC